MKLFIFGSTIPDAMRGYARLIPPDATVTKKGKRYVRDMANDRMIGEADFLVEKKGAALAAAFDLSLPAEGILPERSCRNPECLLPIDPAVHHRVKYCSAAHEARAKELRRQANRKANRISCTGMNLHSPSISETISVS